MQAVTILRWFSCGVAEVCDVPTVVALVWNNSRCCLGIYSIPSRAVSLSYDSCRKASHQISSESGKNIVGEQQLQLWKKPALTRVQIRPTPALLCDSWPWPLTFDPTINGFPGLVVKHFNIKFDDPSCSGFWDKKRINKTCDQTGRRTTAICLLSLRTVSYTHLTLPTIYSV